MAVRAVVDPAERSRLAERILGALPGWFGLPEATPRYVCEVAELPTWAVDDVAFLSLRQHTQTVAEIHVMGVLEERHRRGLGRLLVETAANAARADGARLLEVKTLGPSHPSVRYARIRRFYEAVGFLPLEELDAIWGVENPCLIMVRVL